MSKKTDSDQKDMNRRQFFRQSACASLGLTGMVSSLAHLRLINSAMASTTPGANDYKAMVVIFLNGGNDSNNMLMPGPTHPERANYDTGRGVMAIPAAQAHALNSPPSSTDDYLVHPDAPELAALFNSGDLAFVANVGTLVEPVEERSDYFSGNVNLPQQLYSHADQQVQWQSSLPDRPFQSGWGGRISDILNDGYNSNGTVSMNISINGINKLQVSSGDTVQYVVGSGGVETFSGFNNTSDPTGKLRSGFDNVMTHVHGNLLEEEANNIVRRTRDAEAIIGAAEIEAANSGVNFDTLFPNTYLGNELKMIAKLIAGRNSLGNQRQTFFCQALGYDTHNALLTSHANLMNELSEALAAFNTAMTQLGVKDQVLLKTHSDFNRTLTPNSNEGSDHAWGGHQIVMGGAIDGGKVYGEFPSLIVNGGIDTSTTRGRWIPKYSVDQYLAVGAQWFGVATNEMATILPNLGRFDNPFDITNNIKFI